jgi:hypothetical protein
VPRRRSGRRSLSYTNSNRKIPARRSSVGHDPLYPFIGQLERTAGFARDDTATIKLNKLEALLGDGAGPGDISLIAEMLALSGGERFPPLDLSLQRKKERTFRRCCGSSRRWRGGSRY